MSVTLAQGVWLVLFAYAAVGVLVAGWLLLFGGMRRVDPKAAAVPLGVRLLFGPGIVALWPVLLRRAAGHRPVEDRA